jgi:predicted enzyme related to lactoylglutathione lyase
MTLAGAQVVAFAGTTDCGTRVAWFRDPDGNTLAIHQAP